MKKYALPIMMLAVFEAIAITLWLTKDNLFYLFNFSYIGLSLALAVFLFARGSRWARHVSQLLVGAYMLVYLGILRGENMQLEGFWYYLFRGVFEAAVIHYAVAKLAGPLLFGRGWCGYACWTAMVLDFLPFRTSPGRRPRLSWIRVVLFAASLALVGGLFAFGAATDRTMLILFAAGNALYYAAGIALALILRDNRAFCKYLCPVAVFLKPASYFSLMRARVDETKCVGCGRCERACPMDVALRDPSRRRVNGTECILCGECVRACPTKAVRL